MSVASTSAEVSAWVVRKEKYICFEDGQHSSSTVFASSCGKKPLSVSRLSSLLQCLFLNMSASMTVMCSLSSVNSPFGVGIWGPLD